MASLYRRRGSDHWWIRYTRDTKQIRKSTATADKDKALLQLREIELILGQRKSIGTVSQKLVKAIQQETVNPMALHVLLDNRRKHVAPTTRATYGSRDAIFLAWLSRNHPDVALVSEVERDMVRAFLDHVADNGSSRTHNGYLRRLRSVFRSAVRNGYTAGDPTDGIAFMPENGSARRAFTDEELKKLFESLSGDVGLLATLGLYAGAMRMSDIIGLTWANVDLKNDVIRWRMSKRRGKPMEIAIHPRLKSELQSVDDREKDKPVLPRFYKNPDRASEAFRQALVKAGLKRDNRPDINRRHAQRKKEKELAEHQGTEYVAEPVRRRKDELDFHALRYNFVSILKSQGCPEAIARSIMGHASIEVSAIYTQIDAESERKWIKSLPDLAAAK